MNKLKLETVLLDRVMNGVGKIPRMWQAAAGQPLSPAWYRGRQRRNGIGFQSEPEPFPKKSGRTIDHVDSVQ